MIKIKVIEEAGYEPAIFGAALSFGKSSPFDFSGAWDVSRAAKTAEKLAPMDLGHNKNLEQIQLWVDVTAPRYFWQEGDAYRIASKSSESTIHTLATVGMTNETFPSDFDETLPDELLDYLERSVVDIMRLFEYIQNYEYISKKQRTILLKKFLPENFLQRRIWHFSYKTLRNVILQRRNHLLPEWQVFCKEILAQVQHPELLPTL